MGRHESACLGFPCPEHPCLAYGRPLSQVSYLHNEGVRLWMISFQDSMLSVHCYYFLIYQYRTINYFSFNPLLSVLIKNFASC